MAMSATCVAFGAGLGSVAAPTSAAAQDAGPSTTVAPDESTQRIGDELSTALAADAQPTILHLADGRTAIPFGLTDLGPSIVVQGETGDATVSIPVPAGLTPVALRANLVTSPDVQDGYFGYFGVNVPTQYATVGSANRAARSTEIDLDVRGIEVREGRAKLSIQTVLKSLLPGCEARLSQATMELRGGAFVYEGTPTPPVAPSSFLGPVTDEVTIALPEDPSPAEATAAVRLASSIARLRPNQTPRIAIVSLSDSPASGFEINRRRVEVSTKFPDEISVVRDEHGAAVLRFGGSSGQLLENVRVYDSDLSDALINTTTEVDDYDSGVTPGPLDESGSTTETDEPSAAPADGSSMVLPLRDLGLDSTQRRGVGALEMPLMVDQSKLGGSVKSLRIHLQGTHTPPPKGAEALMTVYVADTLVASLDLANSEPNETETAWNFAIDVDVPSELIGRTTGSVVRVDYIPPGGDCKVGAAPFVVQVSSSDSYYQVEFGQGELPGFAQVPQSIWPEFTIAVDQLSIERVAIAARLVASLQLLATQRAEPTVTTVGDLGDRPGPRIMIGEGAIDDAGYITLGSERAIRGKDAAKRLTISTDEAIAGLTVFRRHGDVHLDLFWTRSDEGNGMDLARALLMTIEGDHRSFRDLYGDTYLMAADTPPVSLDLSGAPIQPTEARQAPNYLTRAVPMAAGAAVAGAVLLVLAWARRRRLDRAS